MSSQLELPVAIVGAGLAGLCCAKSLHAAGKQFVLLDAGQEVGGRVATDHLDGFLLDRGFQVLLTAYPEAQRQLSYDHLGMKSFRSGSLIRLPQSTTQLTDPWREPWRGIASLFSPILTLADALRMAILRMRLLRDRFGSSKTASEVLDSARISPRLRRVFFEPFFGGVTLDRELGVPADYFAFLFRMFAEGDAALPMGGMGAIPRQLADALPAEAVRLGQRVVSLEADHVALADGHRIDAAAVVVATDGRSAHQLAGTPDPEGWNSTTTLYFAAKKPPIAEPTIMLDGVGDGPVLHMCVPSNVQPSYAPAGQSLVSVSVLGLPSEGDDELLVARVCDQLAGWFGDEVTAWRHLRTYRIPYAQPRIPSTAPGLARAGVREIRPGLLVCGDHLATPSIQGAMLSGRRAAEALLASAELEPAERWSS